jgi:hypothetical protein
MTNRKQKAKVLRDILSGKRSLNELLTGESYIVMTYEQHYTVTHYKTKVETILNGDSFEKWKEQWETRYGKSKNNCLFIIL